MAFAASGLTVFATVPDVDTGSYCALASFRTNDTKATVETAGYFNNAADDLPLGSQIFVAGDLDGTPFHQMYVVDSNDGSTVSIAGTESATFTASFALTAILTPIGTAGQVYFACPINCNITAVYTALNATISGADETITIKAPDGTVGTITIAQSGSAVGDVDSLTFGLNNTEVDAGEAIEVETAGTSTGSGGVTVTVLCEPR